MLHVILVSPSRPGWALSPAVPFLIYPHPPPSTPIHPQVLFIYISWRACCRPFPPISVAQHLVIIVSSLSLLDLPSLHPKRALLAINRSAALASYINLFPIAARPSLACARPHNRHHVRLYQELLHLHSLCRPWRALLPHHS